MPIIAIVLVVVILCSIFLTGGKRIAQTFLAPELWILIVFAGLGVAVVFGQPPKEASMLWAQPVMVGIGLTLALIGIYALKTKRRH